MAILQKHGKHAAPGRRERRRQETRERIFRAAMQLFAERGFFQTTTEDITEAADVGQGTFFNYFPTKQHVLTVLSEKQLEKVMAAREEAETGAAPIEDVLQRLTHRIAEEPGRSQALTRSLMTALISNDEVRELVRGTMGCGREAVAAVVALGQQRGEIRQDRKPIEAALAFQRGVIGTLLLWAMQPQGDLHAWLELAFRDFWAAFKFRHEEPQAAESKTLREPDHSSKQNWGKGKQSNQSRSRQRLTASDNPVLRKEI